MTFKRIKSNIIYIARKERDYETKVYSLIGRGCYIIKFDKEKYGFKSDGQTVSYLIHKHEQGFEELAVAVRKELEENYLPKERIRWGVQTAEQNTIMMMDVLNTLLWLFNAKNCYRVGEITHPVIKESKDELKKR